MQLDSLLAPKWNSSSFLLLLSPTTGTAASNRLPFSQLLFNVANIEVACYKTDAKW